MGALTAVGAFVFGGAAPTALPESRMPGSRAVARVEIHPETLSPSRVQTGEDGRVVLENHSTALARVEFRVARGERVPCRTGRGEARSSRRFVVDDGHSLTCELSGERVDFTVFRMVGVEGGAPRPRRSDGRIDVAAP